MKQYLCEDTLAHPGNAQIPFAQIRVAEFLGETSGDNQSEHEYNVCVPCADYLTKSPWVRVRIVEQLRDEVELRAEGLIQDPVPVGSGKATPGWNGRTVTSIVYAETLVMNGARRPEYLVAVVNEVARLGKVKRRRQVQGHVEEARRQYATGLISEGYRDHMINEALDGMRHVALDKA